MEQVANRKFFVVMTDGFMSSYLYEYRIIVTTSKLEEARMVKELADKNPILLKPEIRYEEPNTFPINQDGQTIQRIFHTPEEFVGQYSYFHKF